jgi:hypothetical protein
MPRLAVFWIALFGLLAAPMTGLEAQSLLDPAAEPDRAIALLPGFAPDPLRLSALQGGGSIDATGRGLGADCVGFVSSAPDVRVDLGGALPLLRLIFMADTITTDTTLIVRDPAGRFLCNNNTRGLFNPMVDVQPAVPGTYAIWVGGFTPGSPVFGALYLTTNPGVTPGTTDLNVPLMTAVPTPTLEVPVPVPLALIATPEPASPLDGSLAPQHGSASLAASFLPDPFWAVVIAGGSIAVPAGLDARPFDPINRNPEVGALVAGGGCGGYAEAAPDYRIIWGGGSTRLRFHLIAAQPQDDLALIVRAPDGLYTCSRDFAPGLLNPSIEFLDPAAGEYAIWAAAEASPLARSVATLYVTELPTSPETVVRAETRAQPEVIGLTPRDNAAVPVVLGASAPEPLIVPGLFAGGPVDVAALNPAADPNQGCEGFFPAEPSVVISIPQPLPFLRVFAIGADDAADLTLALRLPDGTWYCADDSFGTLHPTIDVIGRLTTGSASVWLGSYRPEGAFAVLYLSRTGGPSPVDPAGAPRMVELDAAALTAFIPTPTPLPPTPLDAVAYALTVTPPLLDASLYIATPIAGAQAGASPIVAGLDAAAIPNYGEIVGTGQIQAIAGGSLDAAALGAGCAGFVTAAPDVRIQWNGGGLRVAFSAFDGGDATLIIRRPDGLFACADDTGTSFDPLIELLNAPPGSYAVWIGSFNAGTAVPGLLTVDSLFAGAN